MKRWALRGIAFPSTFNSLVMMRTVRRAGAVRFVVDLHHCGYFEATAGEGAKDIEPMV